MYYVNDFKEWAMKQYAEYKTVPEHIEANVYTDFNVCTCMNIKKKKVAFAKCHPDDQFDVAIGIGVAYAKLMGREIPQETVATSLSHLSAGDSFIFRNIEYAVIGQSLQFKGYYVCEKKNTNILKYFSIGEQVRKIQ